MREILNIQIAYHNGMIDCLPQKGCIGTDHLSGAIRLDPRPHIKIQNLDSKLMHSREYRAHDNDQLPDNYCDNYCVCMSGQNQS